MYLEFQASKLKRKYHTMVSSKQQNETGDDKKFPARTRTKKLPFKVRFNMESQRPVETSRRMAITATRQNAENAAGNEAKSAKLQIPKNSKKYLDSLFDESYFNNVDKDGKLALAFYGDEAILKDEDLEEECIIEGCDRKFLTYFSMMRHVAFHHRPARTARLMKLFDWTLIFELLLADVC